MKKIIISSLFIGMIVFSCAKKRTCTETYKSANGTVTTSVTVYDKLTSKEKKDIENYGSYTNDDGSSVKTECK